MSALESHSDDGNRVQNRNPQVGRILVELIERLFHLAESCSLGPKVLISSPGHILDAAQVSNAQILTETFAPITAIKITAGMQAAQLIVLRMQSGSGP